MSDESLRDSIREVFKIWIARDINERQDGQRSDGWLHRFLGHFFDTGDEPIAAPRHRLDVFAFSGTFAQRVSQRRDVTGNVPFFNCGVMPDELHYLVFAQDVSTVLDQREQNFKDLWR